MSGYMIAALVFLWIGVILFVVGAGWVLGVWPWVIALILWFLGYRAQRRQPVVDAPRVAPGPYSQGAPASPQASPAPGAPSTPFGSAQDTAGAPLPPPPPPAQPPGFGGTAPACATCGKSAAYIPRYDRYYCYACKQYV